MTGLIYKLVIAGFFIAAVISLGSGFYFLLKDGSKRKRTANALLLRVVFCALLMVVLVYGFYTGELQFTSPVGLNKVNN